MLQFKPARTNSAQLFGVSGGPEISNVLKEMPSVIERNVMKGALRGGARIIAKDAKARVHVRSGDLKKGITTRAPRRPERGKAEVVIGFKKPVSRRAHLEEYGTRHSPAHPFMRPALEAKGPEAIAKIAALAALGTTREARKLAGRFLSINKSVRRQL